MTLGELLVRLANLINTYGPDSAMVRLFIEHHRTNQEFVELAQIAIALKKGLSVHR